MILHHKPRSNLIHHFGHRQRRECFNIQNIRIQPVIIDLIGDDHHVIYNLYLVNEAVADGCDKGWCEGVTFEVPVADCADSEALLQGGGYYLVLVWVEGNFRSGTVVLLGLYWENCRGGELESGKGRFVDKVQERIVVG